MMPVLEEPGDGLLEAALATGDGRMIDTIVERLPRCWQWTVGARRALEAALENDNRDLIRLLLAKHATPPDAGRQGRCRFLLTRS